MSFIVIESIFRLIVSVSMLTALPTASTKTASVVRLWTAVPVFRIFDNPGQSLIQTAKYLLSWFRIGRYLQCPPRKEPPDSFWVIRVRLKYEVEAEIRRRIRTGVRTLRSADLGLLYLSYSKIGGSSVCPCKCFSCHSVESLHSANADVTGFVRHSL